jgi:hypothetical protein
VTAARRADWDVDGAPALVTPDDQPAVADQPPAADAAAVACGPRRAARRAATPCVGGEVSPGAQVIAVPPGAGDRGHGRRDGNRDGGEPIDRPHRAGGSQRRSGR